MLLKISLASEFSFLDSKSARVHTLLRCSFQITLPLQCQTLPTTTHKGFSGVQSLKRKWRQMPLVHQGKSQARLPLAPYPRGRTVPCWNHPHGVSPAKSASASRGVTLAGTTSTSQNHVELKVNSPFDNTTKKKHYAQKSGLGVSCEKQNTNNCVGLNSEKKKKKGKKKRKKAYSPLMFCMRKFPGVEGRNEKAVLC